MNRPSGRTDRARRPCAPSVLLALSCALTFAPPGLSAQEGEAPGDTAVVAVPAADPGLALDLTSGPPGALVYLDGALLGETPLRIHIDDSLAGGREVVVLNIVGGDPRRWFVPVVTDSIRVAPAGTGAASLPVARHYDLPLPLRITSDPSGAEVLLGDSVLGTTPLLTMVPRNASRLDLRRDGYEPQSAMLSAGLSDYRIALVPREAEGAGPLSALPAGGGRSYTPAFFAAGSAVVAGAASAWLKNLADRSYEEYRSTGDGATLDRVRRYDVLSGISLVVAEISIGYLVIDLLSR